MLISVGRDYFTENKGIKYGIRLRGDGWEGPGRSE